jgi:hypothetical protein
MEPSAQLSEEHAAYMRNLYSLNVPASAIGAVEGRLREGGTPPGKSRLTFDHILSRLQGVAEESGDGYGAI